MKSLAACFFLASLALGQPAPLGGEPYHRVRLPSADPDTLAHTLETLGYDVLHQHGPDFVEIIVSRADHDLLFRTGYQPRIQETAQPLATKFPDGPPAGYNDLGALTAGLFTTQATYPNLAQVVDIAAVYGPGSTFEGRPIHAIKLSDNVTQNEDEPAILVVATHHCREVNATVIALDTISRLTSQYGIDPAVTALLNNHEVWIVPVVNPDGYAYVWATNNLWRKNRRPFGANFGVDLNRNYDLGWSSTCAGSTNSSSDTYKGPSPNSEAETQTIAGLSVAKNFAKVLDFHSFGREVLLSYLCTPIPPTIEALIDSEGVALANSIGWQTRDPSADGEHQEWQTKSTTSYAYLVEIGLEFQPTFASAQAEAQLLRPLVSAFFNRPIPVVGHVTDQSTGLPVAASITVQGINWSAGEHRQSEGLFGRYHLFLPAGTHQVTFAAPSYQSKTVAVTVTGGQSTTSNVQLLPSALAFNLALSTTGGGVNNLTVAVNNVPPATSIGFCVFSATIVGAPASGTLFGITPDALSLLSLTSVPSAGSPFAWTWPVAPPLFPAGPFSLPPGGVPFAPGASLDGFALALTPVYSLVDVTLAVRVTF